MVYFFYAKYEGSVCALFFLELPRHYCIEIISAFSNSHFFASSLSNVQTENLYILYFIIKLQHGSELQVVGLGDHLSGKAYFSISEKCSCWNKPDKRRLGT